MRTELDESLVLALKIPGSEAELVRMQCSVDEGVLVQGLDHPTSVLAELADVAQGIHFAVVCELLDSWRWGGVSVVVFGAKGRWLKVWTKS